MSAKAARFAWRDAAVVPDALREAADVADGETVEAERCVMISAGTNCCTG